METVGRDACKRNSIISKIWKEGAERNCESQNASSHLQCHEDASDLTASPLKLAELLIRYIRLQREIGRGFLHKVYGECKGPVGDSIYILT